MSKRFYFEQPAENQLARQEQKEEDIKKLEDFVEDISGGLNEREKEVLVDRDCRINLDTFDGIYPREVIEKDKAEVRKYEEKWYKDLPEAEIRKRKSEQAGEQLEMLKTAIFSKNLHENFIVARASSYDDIKNGVDNIILEKETGNLVCALDEVSEISGSRFEQKKEEVLDKNRKGGGELKYGIRLEKGKISLGKVKNLPIFYLALPQRHIRKGMEELIPSFQEKSKYERDIFNWFISSLDSQIKSLKLEPRLNEDLNKRLLRFEKAIQRFKT